MAPLRDALGDSHPAAPLAHRSPLPRWIELANRASTALGQQPGRTALPDVMPGEPAPQITGAANGWWSWWETSGGSTREAFALFVSDSVQFDLTSPNESGFSSPRSRPDSGPRSCRRRVRSPSAARGRSRISQSDLDAVTHAETDRTSRVVTAWLTHRLVPVTALAAGVAIVVDHDSIIGPADLAGTDVQIVDDWWELRRMWESRGRRRSPDLAPLALVVRGALGSTTLPWDIEQAADLR